MQPALGHQEEPELVVACGGQQGQKYSHAERGSDEHAESRERGLVGQWVRVIRWHEFDYRRVGVILLLVQFRDGSSLSFSCFAL